MSPINSSRVEKDDYHVMSQDDEEAEKKEGGGGEAKELAESVFAALETASHCSALCAFKIVRVLCLTVLSKECHALPHYALKRASLQSTELPTVP